MERLISMYMYDFQKSRLGQIQNIGIRNKLSFILR